MRTAIVTMLLVVVSGNAMAEWVEVAQDETHTTTFYVDPTTIHTSGDVVEMSSMYDFKTVAETDGMKYLSTRGQREYDCKEGQVRLVSLSLHSRNMGAGAEIHYLSDPLSKWEPVTTMTVGEALWNIACGKL
jgi:hypothetical protein